MYFIEISYDEAENNSAHSASTGPLTCLSGGRTLTPPPPIYRAQH